MIHRDSVVENIPLAIDGYVFREVKGRPGWFRCRSCQVYAFLTETKTAILENQHRDECKGMCSHFLWQNVISRNTQPFEFLVYEDVKITKKHIDKETKEYFNYGYFSTTPVPKIPTIYAFYAVDRAKEVLNPASVKWRVWHSTRLENAGGIIQNGFVSNPPAQITGLDLGAGIYFSRFTGLSLVFCHPRPNDKFAIIFLVDVDMTEMENVSTKEDAKNSKAPVVKVIGRIEADPAKRLKEIAPKTFIPSENPITHTRQEIQCTVEQLVVRQPELIKIRAFAILQIAKE